MRNKLFPWLYSIQNKCSLSFLGLACSFENFGHFQAGSRSNKKVLFLKKVYSSIRENNSRHLNRYRRQIFLTDNLKSQIVFGYQCPWRPRAVHWPRENVVTVVFG